MKDSEPVDVSIGPAPSTDDPVGTSTPCKGCQQGASRARLFWGVLAVSAWGFVAWDVWRKRNVGRGD